MRQLATIVGICALVATACDSKPTAQQEDVSTGSGAVPQTTPPVVGHGTKLPIEVFQERMANDAPGTEERTNKLRENLKSHLEQEELAEPTEFECSACFCRMVFNKEDQLPGLLMGINGSPLRPTAIVSDTQKGVYVALLDCAEKQPNGNGREENVE